MSKFCRKHKPVITELARLQAASRRKISQLNRSSLQNKADLKRQYAAHRDRYLLVRNFECVHPGLGCPICYRIEQDKHNIHDWDKWIQRCLASSTVEHLPRKQEVVGPNPARGSN